MTLDQINMLTHYRNVSGMTYRERNVWDMAVFKAVTSDGDVDIAEIMRQCSSVSTDVIQFFADRRSSGGDRGGGTLPAVYRVERPSGQHDQIRPGGQGNGRRIPVDQRRDEILF